MINLPFKFIVQIRFFSRRFILLLFWLFMTLVFHLFHCSLAQSLCSYFVFSF
jgi:hypothetical protein